jgi:hypothetical protein
MLMWIGFIISDRSRRDIDYMEFYTQMFYMNNRLFHRVHFEISEEIYVTKICKILRDIK